MIVQHLRESTMILIHLKDNFFHRFSQFEEFYTPPYLSSPALNTVVKVKGTNVKQFKQTALYSLIY